MSVVFEPEVQSLPKMASGPTKKKIVPARKIAKKTITPMEKSPSRHVPLLYFLDMPFIDPVIPATPNSKKMMELM